MIASTTMGLPMLSAYSPKSICGGRAAPRGGGGGTLYGEVKSSYGGAGGWNRRGCATWAPRSATRQGEEQHRHPERGSHTRRDKGGHSRQGGGAQQGGRGNWNSGNREPEWSGWQSVRMGGSDNKGDGLASQPRRYRVPGQPLLNRHQVGGVSRSPDGLFAQQEWEPIRGRPTVRGKRTYSGRPGQRVEEGTWAAQKHSEAGDGRPVDRGVWTAKTVKRPRQQPAHPQYANYWAPLTRKRHTMPHSAQSQHANYWAPRTRKRHQQEHRPQRPTASSDPTQHAKRRTGDRPGPRKGATTRRNVTQGGGQHTRVRRWAAGVRVGPPKVQLLFVNDFTRQWSLIVVFVVAVFLSSHSGNSSSESMPMPTASSIGMSSRHTCCWRGNRRRLNTRRWRSSPVNAFHTRPGM